MTAIVEAKDLARHYDVSRGPFRGSATVRALAGASFTVEAGTTLAVVGESGCGKSTLARLITMIEPPTDGTLTINGQSVAGEAAGGHASGRPDKAVLKALRKTVQIVFQDPYGSLNPRQKVGSILEEPLVINTKMPAAERRARAFDMLTRVGLRPEHYGRYPHMFSGGQRQRIAVARALMLDPKILVLDEPVSALDVSIQAQVLNLLADLQDEFGLTYIFISHDLSVVRFVADQVMVMYLGRPVEMAPVEAIFANPRHPYTRALLCRSLAQARQDQAGGRIALALRSAAGLRLPSALPLCARCLPHRESGTGQRRRRRCCLSRHCRGLDRGLTDDREDNRERAVARLPGNWHIVPENMPARPVARTI
jgi:dipeptide transport system ATP-binding protein